MMSDYSHLKFGETFIMAHHTFLIKLEKVKTYSDFELFLLFNKIILASIALKIILLKEVYFVQI